MDDIFEEIDWDEYFLGMAEYAARKSKDPSTKVGAVIVRPDKSICSVAFNGFPRKLKDDPALYANRDTKLKRIVHAERNAIYFARERLDGYTLYSSFEPCVFCTPDIIQSGITRIVTRVMTTEQSQRWEASSIEARLMLREAGIQLDYL